MEYKVTCPYCHEKFSMTVHQEDGVEQEFVYDCEVCCHPIDVKASWDEDHHKFKVIAIKDSDDFAIGW
jgi:hypothetical protein